MLDSRAEILMDIGLLHVIPVCIQSINIRIVSPH